MLTPVLIPARSVPEARTLPLKTIGWILTWHVFSFVVRTIAFSFEETFKSPSEGPFHIPPEIPVCRSENFWVVRPTLLLGDSERGSCCREIEIRVKVCGRCREKAFSAGFTVCFNRRRLTITVGNIQTSLMMGFFVFVDRKKNRLLYVYC